jgi:hypothetical protein
MDLGQGRRGSPTRRGLRASRAQSENKRQTQIPRDLTASPRPSPRRNLVGALAGAETLPPAAVLSALPASTVGLAAPRRAAPAHARAPSEVRFSPEVSSTQNRLLPETVISSLFDSRPQLGA